MQRLEDKWLLGAGLQEWNYISRCLWRSRVDIKIKIFFWKLLHRGFPIGERVIHFREDIGCKHCGNIETVDHLFWSGCIASRFWKTPMNGTLVLRQFKESKVKEMFPILA